MKLVLRFTEHINILVERFYVDVVCCLATRCDWVLTFCDNRSYDQIQPEIYNASRGMAARASSFSRHSARSGSADLVRWSKDTGAGDDRDHNNIIRSNSGGRMRSLHLTSIENPFMRREQKKVVPMASSDLQLSIFARSFRCFNDFYVCSASVACSPVFFKSIVEKHQMECESQIRLQHQ